jgi:hypothetical protein
VDRTATPYFKRDAQFRARLFDPSSFQHDAKANLYLVHWLIDRYTQPGQVVLDPMAGTGSIYLGAAAGARRVMCGELETWMRPILNNNRRRAGGWSRWQPGAYQGDAANLPIAPVSVDHVLFSPPYWDTFSDWHISNRRMKPAAKQGPVGSAYADERGSKEKKNAGNLHVYEDFLAFMRLVYAECWRVTRPGGRLLLIVKDRIAAGQRVPIVDDTVTTLTALGWVVDEVLSREAQLTQYRQLQKAKGMPIIADEQVIVAHKGSGQPKPSVHYQIVFPPDVDHGPPMQVYDWTCDLAIQVGEVALAYTPAPGPAGVQLNTLDWTPRTWPDPFAKDRYTRRRLSSFDAAKELVDGWDLRAGDTVTLYVPWRYGLYLGRRLKTFGAVVETPMRGLNMGQKMTWLKRHAAH